MAEEVTCPKCGRKFSPDPVSKGRDAVQRAAMMHGTKFGCDYMLQNLDKVTAVLVKKRVGG